MENAADALKIAFAVLVFVIAITILFTMISKVKATSDVALYYSDNTNFQEHTPASEKNRIVGVSDIISTLYRYYNESVAITVILTGGEEYNFDLGNETILIKDENNNLLKSLSTKKNIEKNLGEFITENLFNNSSSQFIEEFVEVPISGMYVTGDDGSEITLSSGSKKVYVTYKEQ